MHQFADRMLLDYLGREPELLTELKREFGITDLSITDLSITDFNIAVTSDPYINNNSYGHRFINNNRSYNKYI